MKKLAFATLITLLALPSGMALASFNYVEKPGSSEGTIPEKITAKGTPVASVGKMSGEKKAALPVKKAVPAKTSVKKTVAQGKRVFTEGGYEVEIPPASEAEKRAAERYEKALKAGKRYESEKAVAERKAREAEENARREKAALEKAEKLAAEKNVSAPVIEEIPVAKAISVETPEEVTIISGGAGTTVISTSPETTVIAAVPVKAVELPEATKAAPEPVVIENAPAFTLEKGSMREQLAKYSKEQGYQLSWNCPNDLVVTNVTVFSTGTYSGNVRELFETLQKVGRYDMSATLFKGNKTLVVEPARR